MPKVEIAQDPGRDDIDHAFVRNVGIEVLKMLGKAQGEVSLLFSGDSRIRELNRRFRNVDAATDVMAFPSGDRGGFLGDIIISVETASRQADQLGHSLQYELAVLLVHGILHLIGYTDHDDGAQEEMSRRSEGILKRLNLSQS